MDVYGQEKRLNEIRDMAERYAVLEKRDRRREDRDEIKQICRKAAKFNALEMAHFCQQAISWIPDVHQATMMLTKLTNRVLSSMNETAGQ